MKNKNGLLNVVKRDGDTVICLCDCGKKLQKTIKQFYNSKSCGCLKTNHLRSRAKIHTCDKFGFLVVEKSEGKDSSGNYRWLCKCFCGSKVSVRSSSLISGKSKSCGCISAGLRNESYYSNRPELAQKYIKK